MALTGSWGDGKTSVLNLVREQLEEDPDVIVVGFNPWLFSDTEALVTRFFSELADELERHRGLKSLARALLDYGVSLLPLLGPYGSILASGAWTVKRRAAKADLHAKRMRIEKTLDAAGRRIVVLVDDIDRLQPDEIRDVMRLVKLVGDLPYMTYLLAFERGRVENVLGEEGAGGRYLEKIVALTHELPEPQPRRLETFLIDGLNELISEIETLDIDKGRWESLLVRGILPFIGNMRDVRRYLNSIAAPLRMIGAEIALEDLLGLESLRLFEPSVHAGIPAAMPVLVKGESRNLFSNAETRERADQKVAESLLSRAVRNETAVREILSLLFRADLFGGSSIEAEYGGGRRVTDAALLRSYLRMTLDEGVVSASDYSDVQANFGSPGEVSDVLGRLDGKELFDLYDRLRREPSLPETTDPVGLAVVFLSESERLITPHVGPLQLPVRLVVRGVITTIILSCSDSADVARRIYDHAPNLSAKAYLIAWFGTFGERERKEPETELLPEAVTRQLQADLVDHLLAVPSLVAGEPQIEFLVSMVASIAPHRLGCLVDDDTALRAMIAASLTTVLRTDTEGLVLDERTVFDPGILRRLPDDRLGSRVVSIQDRGDLSDHERAAAEAAVHWISGQRSETDS
jgi:hypothetical protein